MGPIIARPTLGGLHHEYEWRAACPASDMDELLVPHKLFTTRERFDQRQSCRVISYTTQSNALETLKHEYARLREEKFPAPAL